MNIAAIKQAKAEALRFIQRVNALEQSKPSCIGNYLDGSKHTGAVKRASMDLTRSLSELRKPG